jgi:hypothetical protein
VSEAGDRSRVELVATILLALAAVATAWSSYQAARWNGEQAKAASRTTGIRIEAARADDRANAETEVDVATFIQWIDANAHDDTELADFYEERFREEFKPAFDAWLATDPLENSDAPPTPFAVEEYRVSSQEEAARLDEESEASAADVRLFIQRSADYVLAVVLFTVSLFFAGMSTKLESQRLQKVLLGIGCALFLGVVAWIATFPVLLTV